MICTNKNCPAYAKCLAPYRGSRCKATRSTYGLGDPLTNADRIRAMTDEELAYFMANIEPCRESAWLEWLRQEAKNEL
jgi:hypothetical protein